MTIKKLTKQFVESMGGASNSELTWATDQGLVATSSSDEESFISFPIYNDNYDRSDQKYEFWKQLFVARSLQDSGDSPRRLFEEVADIATAFGYPEDMNALIYYMPAQGEGSEATLIKRIIDYASLPGGSALPRF